MIKFLGAVYILLSLLTPMYANELFIMSNAPEQVMAPGLVFQERLTQQPLRLMYYHKNGLDTPIYIRVVARNTSQEPIQLAVHKALSGPDPDGVFVGHQSAKRFLEQRYTGQGDSVTLAPGESQVLVYQLMKVDMVSTGILRVAPSQPGIQIAMSMVDPEYGHLSALNAHDQDAYYVERTWASSIQEEAEVDLNQAVTDMVIGETGNYGVIHRYKVALHNPSSTYKRVRLLLSPLAGVARAAVLVNGELKEVAMIQAQPKPVDVFTIEPRATKHVSLVTMPQAGSFYPVGLVFQSKDHGMIGGKVGREDER